MDRAIKPVRKEVRRSGRVGAGKHLVDSARQKVRDGRTAGLFLYNIRAIVQIIRGESSNSFSYPTAIRVILKTNRTGVHRGKFIPRVPSVAIRPIAGHIAVRVIGERSASPRRQLVVSIIRGRTDHNRIDFTFPLDRAFKCSCIHNSKGRRGIREMLGFFIRIEATRVPGQ